MFVDGFYCLPSEYEEPQIDIEIDKHMDKFFSVLIAPPGKEPKKFGQRFYFPTLGDDLDFFAKQTETPIDDMKLYSFRSAVPIMFEPQKLRTLNDLAVNLWLLEGDDFVKLKALLQTLPTQGAETLMDIVEQLDDYELDRNVRSYDEFGQKYLQKLLPSEFSSRALDDTYLTDLGCNVLFMKGGTITTYGALSGKGQQLYTAIVDETMQEESEDEAESEDESEDMEMGVIS